MRYFCLFLFQLLAIGVGAQNLVPNPSFEEYTPTAPLLDTICSGNNALYYGIVDGWKSWRLSPDYHNACSNEDFLGQGLGNNPNFGVPFNEWGYQEAFHGNGYISLLTFGVFQDIREYPACTLLAPLKVDSTYYCRMRVSVAETLSSDSVIVASNNLGFRFADDLGYNPQFSQGNEGNVLMPDNSASINFTQVITDTANWVLLEGWYTADEPYSCLTIGNFYVDNQTDTMHLNSNALNNQQIYPSMYYIDSLCVARNPEDCNRVMYSNEVSQIIQKLIVYPNPTNNGIIKIQPSNDILRVEIRTLTGKLMQFKYNSNIELDLSNLAKGMYLITVTYSNGLSRSSKILFI